MPKKKLVVNATDEQLANLYRALQVGTPITVALSLVGISVTTFYYWIAIYSVVVYCKEQDELEELERLSKAGVSIQEIKDLSAAMTHNTKKSAIGTYIEPKQETVLRYRNSISFKHFADEVYQIINKCNQLRSEVVMKHLSIITASTDPKKHIKASGSMWFLERTQADYFGRAADKVIEEDNAPGVIPSIQVEFVDPKNSEDRLKEMETKVLEELKGSGDA